jgi:hypothetical protein
MFIIVKIKGLLMIKNILFTFILFHLAINTNQLFSKNIDFFVSTKGNDLNNGKSIKSPFKTIQKAANFVRAGGTVYIMGGIYSESIDIKYSGSDKNEIVFKNYKNQLVVIDGEHKYPQETWRGLFSIFNKKYIKVLGLNLKNSLYAGVLVVDSQHITIENVSTYNTFSSGLGIWGSQNILIKKNRVELACNGGTDESITIGESQHCVVRDNEVLNNGNPINGGEGIDIKDGSEYVSVYGNDIHDLHNRTGIYVDGWDKDTVGAIKVYNNKIHDCNHTAMAIATERGGHLQNVSFFNNIIYNNSDVGILLGGWISHDAKKPDPTHTPITNVKLMNNTIYNNKGGIVILNKDIKNLIIRNNICSKNSPYNAKDYEILVENNSSSSNIIIDHNIFHGRGSKDFPSEISTAPLFKNVLKYDFHLNPISPAVNSGSNILAPLIDFDWNNRNIDEKYDIGAYMD